MPTKASHIRLEPPVASGALEDESPDALTGEALKQAVKLEIARRIKRDELDVPMLPHIVNQVMTLARRPNATMKELTDVVRQDQQLSARIIKLANSPVYRTLYEVTTIHRAIVTIGMRTMMDFIFSVSMGAKVFRSAEFEGRMSQLWRHSVACAFVTQHLAYRFHKDVDNAFVLGLLHDIGKPLILDTITKMIHKEPRNYNIEHFRGDFLEEILQEFHGPVGALIGKKWSFPDAIITAILHHHDPLSISGEKDRDGVLLVSVANLLCVHYGLCMSPRKTDLSGHPWIQAFGLSAADLADMDRNLQGEAELFIGNFLSTSAEQKPAGAGRKPQADPHEAWISAIAKVHDSNDGKKAAGKGNGFVRRVLKYAKRYFWVLALLVLLAGIGFFIFTGNEQVLPAIYR